MHFQWYPGHMTKAKRAMQEDIKLVDLVIELLDARIPHASRNPDIDELGKNKYRLVVLNKSDLADEKLTALWEEFFREKGCTVIKTNARMSSAVKEIQKAILEACAEKIERDRKRGILNRPVRAMVVGIPNVGKSTLINSLAGRSAAKTGNRPGVTKGNQWIRLNKQVELLDTPGILWPKFEDQEIGMNLAFIGSMNDEILEAAELAASLISCLACMYPGALEKRYGVLTEAKNMDLQQAYGVLEEIARIRGCLMKGGELDVNKAAALVLDDFRSGRLGRITLEQVCGKEMG